MNTQAKFPPPLRAELGYKELVLRITPMPSDCNINGDIFGGWLMSQMDIAGAIPVCCIAKHRNIATIAVNSIVFKQAVKAGNLLSFYAEIVKIGTTSITVEVSAYAMDINNPDGEHIKVTEANITYVTMDKNRQPIPVLPQKD